MTNIAAMALFSMIMSITPGPVNIITLNSGLNHGFKGTLPYISGATIGFTLLLLCLGLGFSSVIMAYPTTLLYCNYLGGAYMMYMGYKIVSSKGAISQTQQKKAPLFREGALLQCANPKAWMACLSGLAAFTSNTSMIPLITFVSIYFIICYLCISLWALVGEQLKLIITQDSYVLWFNRVMGGLLILTSVYLSLSF
jgi:threonine/homoserine/homoserine lactone efflux protein